MQAIHAVITAWPLAPGPLDPVVFFRESTLRFQDLMDSTQLLDHLQRGAFTVIEYVVPRPSGSCASHLFIRHSVNLDGERFTLTTLDSALGETVHVFASSRRGKLEEWLQDFIEAKKVAANADAAPAPPAPPLPAFGNSPDAPPQRFMVAYVRAEDRRRAGHSDRAAFAFRKTHAEAGEGSARRP